MRPLLSALVFMLALPLCPSVWAQEGQEIGTWAFQYPDD
jgi:hypothetical protein